MPKIRTSLTGFILLLQPALSFIWDVLFFSRPTNLINWLGVIITLVAIYMGVTGNIKTKQNRGE
jgi:drug/metabolite transporter (DMT)-like permease